MPDPQGVYEAGEIVGFAPLDLRHDVQADLAQLAWRRPRRPRLPRCHHQRLERGGVEVVEVREITHEPLGDQLIDECGAEPLDVHGGP